MSKEYKFRVKSIKNNDNKIYKVLEVEFFKEINVAKFFMEKDGKWQWICCNDFKLYEEKKNCGTCAICSYNICSECFNYSNWKGKTNE